MKKTKRRWHIEVDLIDRKDFKEEEFIPKSVLRAELKYGITCLEDSNETFQHGKAEFKNLKIRRMR